MGIAAGLVIESIGQALKAVGFAVPGALGVQEGGYIVICRAYGLPAETGIALSLMKRLREVVLGVPALLAWQLSERRAAPPIEATPYASNTVFWFFFSKKNCLPKYVARKQPIGILRQP